MTKREVLAKNIERLEAELQQAKADYANSIFPYAIGDTGTLGMTYSFQGKKAKIISVEYRYFYNAKHGYIATAQVLKADGSLSKNTVNFCIDDEFIKD